MNSLGHLLVCTWLTRRHGHGILFVSARLLFHTELSTVSVSAEISVCLCLELQMSCLLCHVMLKRETLWIKVNMIPLFLYKMPRFWSDDVLPFAALIIPLPLLLSVFVLLCQTALSHRERSALKIFQVALRRFCLLLHANVLCPTLEDKHKISVWNHSQFTA